MRLTGFLHDNLSCLVGESQPCGLPWRWVTWKWLEDVWNDDSGKLNTESNRVCYKAHWKQQRNVISQQPLHHLPQDSLDHYKVSHDPLTPKFALLLFQELTVSCNTFVRFFADKITWTYSDLVTMMDVDRSLGLVKVQHLQWNHAHPGC